MMISTPNSKSTDNEVLPDKNTELSPGEFSKLAKLLYEKSGIHLTPVKKPLLEGRIRKRLIALNLQSISDYCDYLFSSYGQENEVEFFINVLTTNKTDFLREYGHFQFLIDVGIPALLRKRKRLNFWSAACSRGAEPYTLAMVLEEYIRNNPNCGMEYQILATDISTKVLAEAKQGIYFEPDIAPISEDWRKRYLLRGKGSRAGQFRIAGALRQKVQFIHMNLMEPFQWNDLQDVIFCRNVTIYFDRETQNRLVSKFLNAMQPDGYLIMGHSESLDVMKNPIKLRAPSIYQRVE